MLSTTTAAVFILVANGSHQTDNTNIMLPLGTKILGESCEADEEDPNFHEHLEISVEPKNKCWIKRLHNYEVFVNGKLISSTHSFEVIPGDTITFSNGKYSYKLAAAQEDGAEKISGARTMSFEHQKTSKRVLQSSLSSGDEQLEELLKEQNELDDAKRRKKDADERASFALALQLQMEEDTKMKESVATMARKRSATQLIPLPYGVILFKQCLSGDEQIGILNICSELRSESLRTANSYAMTISKPTSGVTHPMHYFLYNWYKNAKENVRPSDLLEFGQKMFDRAYNYAKEYALLSEDLPAHFRCPSSYKPESLIALLYPPEGRLVGHFDGVDGWVLSMSIGDSCMFSISDSNNGPKTQIKLDSGDLILFNGNKVWHEVERIIPNSGPKFWLENSSGIDNFGYARFNLQFRQQNQRF